MLTALQNFFSVLLSGPGALLLPFAVLLLCVLGTAYLYSRQLRDLSKHLHELSEIMQEQSRAVDSMRRTLEDALDVLASLEASSHYGQGAQETAPGVPKVFLGEETAALLREELESLRAEILADAGAGPRQER